MIGKSGHKIISGLAGLAAGDGFGCSVLSHQQTISQRRVIRFDQSNQTFFKFSGRKCCRGAWSREFGLFHSIFEDCSRLTQGNRNPFHFGSACRNSKSSSVGRRCEAVRRNWPNASLTHPFHTGKAMMTLFAIRYSLLALERSSND